MQTIRTDDTEVTVVFPGGISVALTLAGKSIDLAASVRGRPAMIRTGLDALPRVTVDVVEHQGPEE